MQTRKDLLQAHRLMTQRAGLALLQGEPDTAEQPLRRINIGTFAGVMIAALSVALFWLIGVLTHSGAQLQRNASGTVIMDKDTGQAYIWCQGGGELCPTANFASALLALQSSKVSVRAVSQRSLAQFPPGPEIGIPGLPTPPVPANLVNGPWSVCVRAAPNGNGQQQQTVTLVAGRSVGGAPAGDQQAVLVRAQNRDWVIWNDQRLSIAKTLVPGIGWGSKPIADVPASWLDSITQGPAFAPPAIPNLGGLTFQAPNGQSRIGSVYQVQAVSGTQWYVQLSDGAAPITQAQAALLQAAGSGPTVQVSPGAVTQHLSAKQVPGTGLPASVPAPVTYDPATPLCTVYSGPGQAGQITLNGSVPTGGVATPASSGATVGAVWLPPGRGALVTVGSQGAAPSFLITGARKYALGSQAVAGYLGYSLLTQHTVVPANIIDLIPAGPTLDPQQARLPVTGG